MLNIDRIVRAFIVSVLICGSVPQVNPSHRKSSECSKCVFGCFWTVALLCWRVWGEGWIYTAQYHAEFTEIASNITVHFNKLFQMKYVCGRMHCRHFRDTFPSVLPPGMALLGKILGILKEEKK